MRNFIIGFIVACIIGALVCLVAFGVVSLKTMLISIGIAIGSFVFGVWFFCWVLMH